MTIVLASALAMWFASVSLHAQAPVSLHAQSRSTMERMNFMLEKSLTEIVQQVQADSISVRVGAHADSELFRVMTINAFGWRTIVDGTSAHADLFVTPVDVSTRYETTEAADSVDRVITVAFKAVLTENGSTKAITTESRTERERMHRSDALRLQSTQRSSTHGQIPTVPTTFWDDVLQPAIFVAAAITTVVLLFTVRSQ